MGKKYVMFVDERGFLTEKNENFTLIGVVIESDYCNDSKYYGCELKRRLDEYKKVFLGNSFITPLDDLILCDNVYKSIDENQKKQFISGLPTVLEELKFTIMSSTVKYNTKDSYLKATKKLLREFYTYITEKNGQSGGIVLEAKKENDRFIMQQHFFDIYNERNMNLNIGNISDIINSFVICEKNNRAYGIGIEILNVLNNILFRVSNGHKEFDSRLISYVKYNNRNKVFDVIKHKIYKDIKIRAGQDGLLRDFYNINLFNEELNELKEQLIYKNILIVTKEKEIEKLTNRVQLLKEKLETVEFNNERDTMISKII